MGPTISSRTIGLGYRKNGERALCPEEEEEKRKEEKKADPALNTSIYKICLLLLGRR